MEESLLNKNLQLLDELQEVLHYIKSMADASEDTLSETNQLLFKIGHLETRIQDYQVKADMLGIGLTALALVLAVLALIFMWNVISTARSEAREAAKKEMNAYLKDSENTREVIESWFDNNRSAMVSAMWLAAIKNSDDLGNEYAAAWNASDLPDLPENGDS